MMVIAGHTNARRNRVGDGDGREKEESEQSYKQRPKESDEGGYTWRAH
jgi:hypothetical protein